MTNKKIAHRVIIVKQFQEVCPKCKGQILSGWESQKQCIQCGHEIDTDTIPIDIKKHHDYKCKNDRKSSDNGLDEQHNFTLGCNKHDNCFTCKVPIERCVG